MLMLNPGSCGPRRFTQPITFAVLEIEDDHSFRVERVEISHMQKGGLKANVDETSMEKRMERRDMKHIIKLVMQDTDKGISVSEIARRCDISVELTEQICRLYLTHPGVTADGIMGKMGL